MPIPIPDAFARFIVQLHGDKGKAWLARLPEILASCAEQWQLAYDAPFGNLTYHFVIPARRADGLLVVVKACSPTGEYLQEAEALRLFDGQGMVPLLAHDDANEVMLLQRLVPGTSLRAMADDAAATRIAAGVMRQIWRHVPEDHPFATVDDWHQGFAWLRTTYDGGAGPFPADLVRIAETLYAHLSATSAAPVLLHGDLHHDNILAAGDGTWRGIDPKGLIGEPAYETGSWLRNWLPDLLRVPDPAATLSRRIAIFAEELQMDAARIRDWAIYQAVLSAIASLQDEHVVPTNMLECARLLASL
jgi:streptomycin 6-kinase